MLLKSIRDGKVTPSETDADTNAQFLKDREELATALAGMGLDPKRMSNAAIRAAIKAEVEKRATGQTYDQAKMKDIPTGPDGRTKLFDHVGGFWAKSYKTLFSGRSAPAEATVLRRNFVLTALTGDRRPISLASRAAGAIRQKHPDIPEKVRENLPELLADPLYAFPHTDGGIDFVIDARTRAGEPIVVGVRDGNVRTITPLNDDADRTGNVRLMTRLAAAISSGEKTYMKEGDARVVNATIEAYGARPPGTNLTRRPSEGGSDRRRGEHPRVNVLTRDDVIKSQGRVFYQEARGQITLSDERATITLFQDSDLSTLIHEWAGHLFLEELGFDAKALNASAETRQMWQTVLDALGSKDGYITKEQHEQFAEWAEQYFREGKAPSAALAPAFRSFKRWLMQIYRRVVGLGAPISPEIREVFDRLIATDEQIEHARTVQGLKPVFKDAESAGMTKAEFAAHTKRTDAVVGEAEEKLLQKTMDTIRKQRTKEWKADEARIRETVTGEVMSEAGQQALALLTRGAFPVGTTPEVLKGVKLTKEDIVALYGDKSVLTMLPAGIYRDRAAGPGAISPDELAPMLGLDSGKELIERLMQLAAQKKAMVLKGDKRSVARARIDEETSQRMNERHGDPLNDGTIEQEAMAAVHSDKQAALMATELRILARKAGHTGTITWDAIKAWAASAIAGKSVREGTKFDQYARTERDAGKKVERALTRGDFVAAFKAKQDQMVNHALYMEARKAADDVAGARKLMERYASTETLKDMDRKHLEQIHQLLEQFELKSRSGKFAEERKSYEAWAVEQKAQGFDVIRPPRLDRGLPAINYEEMTVGELRGLVDTVKQVARLGRRKKEMLAGQKTDGTIEAGVTVASKVIGISQSARAAETVPTVARPTGKAYSVAFEMRLDRSVWSRRDKVHFNRANAALDEALRSDPVWAALMEELIPGLQASVAEAGRRRTPRGWVWHHDIREGTMQLVPVSQHNDPKLQEVFHPDGRGGYAIWAVPDGAPPRK